MSNSSSVSGMVSNSSLVAVVTWIGSWPDFWHLEHGDGDVWAYLLWDHRYCIWKLWVSLNHAVRFQNKIRIKGECASGGCEDDVFKLAVVCEHAETSGQGMSNCTCDEMREIEHPQRHPHNKSPISWGKKPQSPHQINILLQNKSQPPWAFIMRSSCSILFAYLVARTVLAVPMDPPTTAPTSDPTGLRYHTSTTEFTDSDGDTHTTPRLDLPNHQIPPANTYPEALTNWSSRVRVSNDLVDIPIQRDPRILWAQITIVALCQLIIAYMLTDSSWIHRVYVVLFNFSIARRMGNWSTSE